MSALNAEPELKSLLVQGLAGSDACYHRFLQQLSPFIRGYFRKRLPERLADVEDLTQEVLIAVHNQRHTYDAQFPVTAWIHGIARYKVIDFFRRNAPHGEHIDIEDAEELLVWEEREARDAQHDVVVLLDELPTGQRDAIRLVKLEGRSVAEAAELTGQSLSLIKVNIHRGLKRLGLILQGSPT
jgi:RNA polymerase sigma-70 factor, ECF subfamily